MYNMPTKGSKKGGTGVEAAIAAASLGALAAWSQDKYTKSSPKTSRPSVNRRRVPSFPSRRAGGGLFDLQEGFFDDTATPATKAPTTTPAVTGSGVVTTTGAVTPTSAAVPPTPAVPPTSPTTATGSGPATLALSYSLPTPAMGGGGYMNLADMFRAFGGGEEQDGGKKKRGPRAKKSTVVHYRGGEGNDVQGYHVSQAALADFKPMNGGRLRRNGGDFANFESMLFKGGYQFAELEGGKKHRRPASPHRRRRGGAEDDMVFGGYMAELEGGKKHRRPTSPHRRRRGGADDSDEIDDTPDPATGDADNDPAVVEGGRRRRKAAPKKKVHH